MISLQDHVVGEVVPYDDYFAGPMLDVLLFYGSDLRESRAISTSGAMCAGKQPARCIMK